MVTLLICLLLRTFFLHPVLTSTQPTLFSLVGYQVSRQHRKKRMKLYEIWILAAVTEEHCLLGSQAM
jgi:hypothetical protein